MILKMFLNHSDAHHPVVSRDSPIASRARGHRATSRRRRAEAWNVYDCNDDSPWQSSPATAPTPPRNPERLHLVRPDLVRHKRKRQGPAASAPTRSRRRGVLQDACGGSHPSSALEREIGSRFLPGEASKGPASAPPVSLPFLSGRSTMGRGPQGRAPPAAIVVG